MLKENVFSFGCVVDFVVSRIEKVIKEAQSTLIDSFYLI